MCLWLQLVMKKMKKKVFHYYYRFSLLFLFHFCFFFCFFVSLSWEMQFAFSVRRRANTLVHWFFKSHLGVSIPFDGFSFRSMMGIIYIYFFKCVFSFKRNSFLFRRNTFMIQPKRDQPMLIESFFIPFVFTFFSFRNAVCNHFS